MSIHEIEKLLLLQNHYQILGIELNSNESEIKKKYRELAMKYHPDKNHNTKSDEAFKMINLAYETLINKESREKYDEFLDKKNKKIKEKKKSSSYNMDSNSNFDSYNSFKNYQKNYGHYNYNYNSYSENFHSKKSDNYKTKSNAYNNYYYDHYSKKKKNTFYSHSHKRELFESLNNTDKNVVSCLLFVLIAIFFPIYITLNVSKSPDIRFEKDNFHQIKHYTIKNEIVFYTNDDFENNYNLTKISDKIEERYLEYIYKKCRIKQRYKQELIYKKKVYNEKLSYNEIPKMYIHYIKDLIKSIEEELKEIDLSYCNEYKSLLYKISKS
jgi:curved DNA-binding protein CbpA